jgi:tetratricopeptide (TPR) repeat protein
LKLEQENADGWFFLGAVQERTARIVEARESYDKALKKQPNHLGAALAQAKLYQREKRSVDAAKLLQETAEAHPASPLPLLELAQLRERENDGAGAIAAYRQLLQRDERNALALNNLAFRLGQDPKTRAEGVQLAERAYQIAPRVPAIADTLGWNLYLAGDLDRAQRLLEEAARGPETEPGTRYHLAQVYARRGKRAEARQQLEIALRTPVFTDAAEARKLLDSLR